MWVSLKNNCDSVTVTGIEQRVFSKSQKYSKIHCPTRSTVSRFTLKCRTNSLNKGQFFG